MSRLSLLSFFLLLLCSTLSIVDAKPRRPGDCEVCDKVINEIRGLAKEKGFKKDVEIENEVRRVCNAYKDLNERRFCYYIGGTDDAATSMLREISTPIKNSVPTDKICDRLNGKDDHICSVRYKTEEKPDYSKMDFSKLSVRELKNILGEWNEKCEGCTEKGDFVALANKVKDKHTKKDDKAKKADL